MARPDDDIYSADIKWRVSTSIVLFPLLLLVSSLSDKIVNATDTYDDASYFTYYTSDCHRALPYFIRLCNRWSRLRRLSLCICERHWIRIQSRGF